MATGTILKPGVIVQRLWVNEDPTSDFGAQSVNLDLSNYDAVLVQCGTSVGQIDDEALIPIGGSARIQYAGYTSSNARIFYREITTSTADVSFGNCGRFTQGSSSITNVATALKGLYIYGIKGII